METAAEVAHDDVPPEGGDVMPDQVHEPVVFTDVASTWPAIGKWSREYFATVFGDFVIPVRPAHTVSLHGGYF